MHKNRRPKSYENERAKRNKTKENMVNQLQNDVDMKSEIIGVYLIWLIKVLTIGQIQVENDMDMCYG